MSSTIFLKHHFCSSLSRRTNKPEDTMPSRGADWPYPAPDSLSTNASWDHGFSEAMAYDVGKSSRPRSSDYRPCLHKAFMGRWSLKGGQAGTAEPRNMKAHHIPTDPIGNTRKTSGAKWTKSIVTTRKPSSVVLEERTIILRLAISKSMIVKLLLLLKTGNAFLNTRLQHQALTVHPRVRSSFEQRYPAALKDEKSANGDRK